MWAFSVSVAEPFFCVALRRDDGKWIIEAKWPDGSTELVETFDDYFEALRWLSAEVIGVGRETTNSEEDRITKRTANPTKEAALLLFIEQLIYEQSAARSCA